MNVMWVQIERGVFYRCRFYAARETYCNKKIKQSVMENPKKIAIIVSDND